MTSPLCDMRCACEECGDRQACDIYYHEMGFQLSEARHEEDRKEREHANSEAQ